MGLLAVLLLTTTLHHLGAAGQSPALAPASLPPRIHQGARTGVCGRLWRPLHSSGLEQVGSDWLTLVFAGIKLEHSSAHLSLHPACD